MRRVTDALKPIQGSRSAHVVLELICAALVETSTCARLVQVKKPMVEIIERSRGEEVGGSARVRFVRYSEMSQKRCRERWNSKNGYAQDIWAMCWLAMH
jgi:hypothetical protein